MTIQNYDFKPREVFVKRNIKTSSYKTQILDKIIQAGERGITADELEIRLKLRSSTISSAINSMVNAKMIVIADDMRPTRSGRKARVYLRRKK